MRSAMRWMWIFAGFGVVLRCVHFLREPAVWHDEAALMLNVIGRSFGEMFGPLLHFEAAPPLFLVVERSFMYLIGDGPSSLRLFPFLCSCLSVVFFALLARKVLKPRAAMWAVLLFACSDRLLWHCCEAKPYAVDTFVGVLIGWMFVSAWQGSFARWTFALAIVAPIMLWMVFPACFLFGGVLVALLPKLRQSRRPIDWIAYVMLAITVGVGFLTLYFGPIRAQRCGPMDGCWGGLMADWSRPWHMPLWSLASTLEVVRYILQPVGQLLVGVLAFGAVAMWRSGQRDLVLVFLTPILLVFFAACIRAYPYGCSRIIVFNASGIVLLIAAGIEPTRQWLANRTRYANVLMIILLMIPVAQGIGRTIQPWDREETDIASEYVVEHIRPGEQIAFRSWEYEYYFRQLPVAPFYCIGDRMPDGPRVWVVVSSSRRETCDALIDEIASGWKVLHRRDFRASTAVLLERSRLPNGS